MGEVRKFRFDPRTLDSEIIKDGLEAVETLEGREPYFLVGGIATQSYLPTRCRRPTADVDFAMVRPLSKPDFREMIKPVSENLKDRGYRVLEKIAGRSRSYALYIRDINSNDLCLEFVRRNEKNFGKHKERLEREYDHTRKKIIEGRSTTYRVCSPEDIAVPKLVRTINSLRRDPQFLNLIPPKLTSFSDEDVEKRVRIINTLREEATSNPGDPLIAERLRFTSDVYDIRMLAEVAGFNPDYFKQAEKDWYDIDSNPELRDKMLSIALPLFLGVSHFD